MKTKPIITEHQCKEITINRCKVVLNFIPESNKRAIERVRSILLSEYYRDIPRKPEETQING